MCVCGLVGLSWTKGIMSRHGARMGKQRATHKHTRAQTFSKNLNRSSHCTFMLKLIRINDSESNGLITAAHIQHRRFVNTVSITVLFSAHSVCALCECAPEIKVCPIQETGQGQDSSFFILKVDNPINL